MSVVCSTLDSTPNTMLVLNG